MKLLLKELLKLNTSFTILISVEFYFSNSVPSVSYITLDLYKQEYFVKKILKT
ncbi:hypothetical protein SDC9_135816 [bioreactor metagenome]|uniref:Uncharacterized protein n=1 Tax=bioreactor metagenome TaxID=1076179 RepID=A0A645DJG5_9ZZZZ